MITFMLRLFYHTHKTPAIFNPPLIPGTLATRDTRAEPQSRQNSVCWWLRDVLCHSSFRSLWFGGVAQSCWSPGASLGSSQLEARRGHPKSLLCLPVCPPPSCLKTLPDCSNYSSKQRLCSRRKRLLLLHFAQAPSHLMCSLLVSLTQPTLQGSPGIKDIVPDSGSSQTHLERRDKDLSEEAQGDMPH